MPVNGLTRESLLKWRLKRPNVAVGIPMLETISRTAFTSFMFLGIDGMRHGDRLLPINAPAVPAEARNSLIRSFLELPSHYRYLFRFDSDMVVPIEALDVMSGYDLPFVSGYTTYKKYPFTPVASVRSGTKEWQGQEVPAYRNITGWEPNTGIYECDATGAAALCLRRDLLEAIAEPWFVHEGAGGEDYYFCRQVQKTRLLDYPDGVPILISTDVPIGHIGEQVAWPSMWFGAKERYYAEHPEEAEIEAEVFGVYREDDPLPQVAD